MKKKHLALAILTGLIMAFTVLGQDDPTQPQPSPEATSEPSIDVTISARLKSRSFTPIYTSFELLCSGKLPSWFMILDASK